LIALAERDRLLQIALLHYSVPPSVGGVETVIGQHARLLVAAGHSVRLLAARGASPGPGVEYVEIPLAGSRHPRVLAVKTELDAGRVPPDFAALTADIGRALAAALTGVDVLVAHNVASLNKNLALTAALHHLNAQPGAPRLILWHHDLAFTTPRYQSELHAGWPWDLLARPWAGAQQLVVSEARRHELAQLMGLQLSQITVVPNGVEVALLLKLEPQTQALVAAMGLTAAAPLLLLPARLTRRKNIELALRTLAALRAGAFPDAMLVITGPEGPHNPANSAYRQELLVLRADLGLAGAAHFCLEHATGAMSDHVVADFYRLADALLLPSLEEGFGIPLIEAAVTRLPVFCSDIPPLRALGQGDVTYFAPTSDPAVVADLVAHRLNADPAARLAARARREYSWEAVFTHHLAPLFANQDNAT
jgi:glycosyltransferase involved in cell wall biosynthesis